MTIHELLDKIPEPKQSVLRGTYNNLEFMEAKLYETMKQAESEPLIVPYDNGGGQSGTRENPIFKAYESLYKSYLAGLRIILEQIPEDIEVEKPAATVLELVQNKHAG